ncbi:MAG: DUF3817 domain-containing protein [Labilithrix sp.]|nr:DUF3817 domain-containing protein [Labilithrix sp.]MCW5812475.1 DUF3817 domain-containing protein [Labilithrix sp.]
MGRSAAMKTLRLVSLLEGISLLVLVGIAMPLKHVWHMPLAVRICGMIHGVLFLALVSALVRTQSERGWPLSRVARLIALALLPFGFIPIERELRRDA